MSRSAAVKVALVLCLLAVLVSSVRFGRLDWTGIPFDRGPVEVTREISPDCTEHVRPYTTDTGRVVSPVVVDEQQYMSMVDHFRGTPRDELHVTCLLDPFAQRTFVPWLARWVPLDEGLALGTVNLATVLIGIVAVLFTLRAQRFRSRVVLGVGALVALGWNTFYFAGVLLVDAAAFGLVAVGWWALATRRPWWLAASMLLAYPIKETAAVVMLPVLAVWLVGELRAGRTGRVRSATLLIAAAGAALVSAGVSRAFFLDGDATWPLAPSAGAFVNNLIGPSPVIFLVATVPLFLPAVIVIRRDLRAHGWSALWTDPATVGVLLTVALCGWVLLAADLSPRFAWIGFPFAATLSARWWSSGRPAEFLERLPVPGWLGVDRGHRPAGSPLVGTDADAPRDQ